jgi:hypothetical protein
MSLSVICRTETDWYFLARNPETGPVFVLHEWSHRIRDTYKLDSEHIELETFLNRGGTAANKLRELIGTLVSE